MDDPVPIGVSREMNRPPREIRSVASLFRNRTTILWALFVAATLASWQLSAIRTISDADHEIVGVVVLAIGFVKARYIGLDFMELRAAPRLLKAIFEVWIGATFALIVALYLLA